MTPIWLNSFHRCFAYLALLLLSGAVLRAGDNDPPEGFTALFNGRDLTGWKGLVANPPRRATLADEELQKAQEAADRSMREHWSVEEGVLVFDGEGKSLCTAKDYGDFELLVDWKIHERGDSGIYLRGSPQVQIWDNPTGSGGLYNNQKNPSKPKLKADRPVEEWNTFRIRMVGERVTVHLNGVLVVDDVVMENYWERDRPIYPVGQIELQDHGNTLYFKNIYLREIPRRYPPREMPEPILEPEDRLAIVGDSITEQKLYSRYIEVYLTACMPQLDIRVLQLGWGGERAPGFAARMENDLLPFHPDVVTTCYGMNDGQYRPYEASIGDTYREAMKDIVERLKARDVQVVVGSPGAVDCDTFHNRRASPRVYNANLAWLRDIARNVAHEAGMRFANVHDSLCIAMEEAKPALGGASYPVCGTDGVHPQANGHLVMAYSFLRALGLDGDLGRITLDLDGPASAEGGHRVLSFEDGRAIIDSSRYPFCFEGNGKSPDSTRSILPYLPFNEHLNRLVLQVKGLKTRRARVTWGETTKSFSSESLEQGINLAAEFPDNPFCSAFSKVDQLVAAKQAFETPMIKEIITKFRTGKRLLDGDQAGLAAMEDLRSALLARDDRLAAQARAAVKPLRHTLVVVGE